MASNIKNLNDTFKRHFYYSPNDLLNLSKDPAWRWNINGSSYDNSDRDNFPLLNQPTVGEFSELKSAINNYEDVIYANRNYKKADETRKLYCSHLMEHILKARKILKKNNDKVSQSGDKIDDIRDQGFHRCRALIIVPTRHSALQIVKCLRSFMSEHKVNKKYKEFIKDFNEQNDEEEQEEPELDSDDDNSDNGEDLQGKELIEKINENLKLSKVKHLVKKSGIDFDEWKIGNTNENFVFGITVEKKLFEVYSKFSNSDIIIGSPIGLREVIDDKKNYINQLTMTTSIQMLIMDQVEYMMVQNFDNIFSILEKLNQEPHGNGECVKIMNSTLRVYDWTLSKQGNQYRQNIIISATLHPYIKKMMSYFHNFQGINIFLPIPQINKTDLLLLAERCCKLSQPVTKKQKLSLNENILFERLGFSVPVPENTTAQILDINPTDSRLGLFKRKVVPLLVNKLNRGGVLIYFTQTIDLYNVRSILQSDNLNVCVVSEDVPDDDVNSIITLFAKGALKYLLLSERYYALTRKRFSAAQHLIYFSTPTFPKFARDFHEFLMWNSKATSECPHHIITLCENELFEQINSQISFKLLYGK